MKVTLFDKGEGYVCARFEAQSGAERIMLSAMALDEAGATLELKSMVAEYDYSVTPAVPKRYESSVWVGSFGVKAHEMLNGKP